jgi:hypothetical protein
MLEQPARYVITAAITQTVRMRFMMHDLPMQLSDARELRRRAHLDHESRLPCVLSWLGSISLDWTSASRALSLFTSP